MYGETIILPQYQRAPRRSTHTGCPGRNVPDFGRMFLKLTF